MKIKKTGFTLIETLVAISILSIAMAAALFAANSSVVAARIARDQLTASLLAQEGIEYSRMLRDNSYLSAYLAGGSDVSTTAWNNFSSAISPCTTPNLCTLDPTLPVGVGSGSALQACSGTCSPLMISSSEIYTQQQTGTVTPFTRTIQFTDVSAVGIRVTSTVSWVSRSVPYTMSVADYLTPWQ